MSFVWNHTMNDTPKHIFTYGSLMFPEVWSRVVKGDYTSCHAWLSGYARRQVHQKDYPALIPAHAENVVQGKVYFDVAAEDQIALDAFEGEEYQRRTEKLLTPEGNEIAVEVYLFKPEFLHQIQDAEWDVSHFEQNLLLRFLHQEGLNKSP
jgi:gamma-glutamylcyclotransferase (GGCT)/AIG2-like uncharacterized protein YtfP